MADITAALGAAFNAAEVEPRADVSELLPAGLYTLEIESAEVKATKAGTGTILKLQHSVIDPEQFARRKVFKTINLANPNPQAEQIGRAELSGLCRAVGIVTLADSDELIGRIVRARVGIRKGTGDYADQNEIKAYESAQAAPAATPAAPKAQVSAKAAPPWAKAKAA
jgi:hypothetical protein